MTVAGSVLAVPPDVVAEALEVLISEADHIDDERLQPQTTPYDGQKLDS